LCRSLSLSLPRFIIFFNVSLSPSFAGLRVRARGTVQLARCTLGLGDGPADAAHGSLSHARVLLFAKLFRGADRWVLHAVGEGRADELRRAEPGKVKSAWGWAEEDPRSCDVLDV
jgi:stress response protein SCP2